MIFRDEEARHKALFEAHWLLVAAAEKIHGAAVACHAAGRHADTRSQLAAIVAHLDRARDASDSAMEAVGKARTEMIRLTGCNRTCHEGASDIVTRTLSAQQPEPSTDTNRNKQRGIAGTESD